MRATSLPRWTRTGNTVLISTGRRPTRLQGISLTPDTKRLYPFGSLAGNVIGFVNADNMGAYGLEASRMMTCSAAALD